MPNCPCCGQRLPSRRVPSRRGWLQASIIRVVRSHPEGTYIGTLISEIYGASPPLNPERVIQRAVSRINARGVVQIYASPRSGRDARRFIRNLTQSIESG